MDNMETSPKDLSHHYSKLVRRVKPSLIKKFYKYFQIPGIGNLAGGLPYSKNFPYDTLEAQVALPERFQPTPNDPVDPPTAILSNGKDKGEQPAHSHIVVPHDSSESNVLRKIDVTTALQYGSSKAYPALATWIRHFTRDRMHPNVPYSAGPETVMTNGSTDGLSKVFLAFSNFWDEERDWTRDRQGLLVEEFAYMNAIQMAEPRGLNIVPVAIDDQGMVAEGPKGLRDVLENWDRRKGKMPHMMYTVTMGHNPTSGILSVKRRKEIYALCSKYDILIIEDDPYWFLQYPSANELSMRYRQKPLHPDYVEAAESVEARKSSGSVFIDSLVPSYLSIDYEGRVLRLDTFSKTIAPGSRLGWITAQPDFIERLLAVTDLTTQQPSGFVQSMVAELILGPHPELSAGGKSSEPKKAYKAWNDEGWIRWLEGLRGNYERSMQAMSQILENGKFTFRHASSDQAATIPTMSPSSDFEIVTKTQLYDFTFPMGGMFIWLRVHFEEHPLFKHPRIPSARLSQAFWVFNTTPKYKVLLAPGTIFSPTEQIKREKGWMYYRLCFAATSIDDITRLSRNLVQATADFFEIDDPKKIDEILKEDDDEEQLADMLLRMSIEMDGQVDVAPPRFC